MVPPNQPNTDHIDHTYRQHISTNTYQPALQANQPNTDHIDHTHCSQPIDPTHRALAYCDSLVMCAFV